MPRPLRVTVLFTRLSGYMSACLKELVCEYGARLQVFNYPAASNAPFEERHFDWIEQRHDRSQFDETEMERLIRRFQPDAAFIAGWGDWGYLRIARSLRRSGLPVIAGCDAQWSGSLKQQIGRITAPIFLKPAVDVLWVAGERQRQTASKLGFSGRYCWSGYYACDREPFAQVFRQDSLREKQFLFAGRYVAIKGLDTLVEAYRRYASSVSDPWRLVCAGTGDQQSLLTSDPRITDVGFVQPDQLPALMGASSAFVLPSRREPWGVVVQEAAAAGLPIICSDACGAAVHLLQDGYNGFSFETGNAQHLADCMLRLASAAPEARRKMGHRSHSLSKQYTPRRWAETLVAGIADLQGKAPVLVTSQQNQQYASS